MLPLHHAPMLKKTNMRIIALCINGVNVVQKV